MPIGDETLSEEKRVHSEVFEAPPTRAQGGVVSIGNFDGVHRGHRYLLRRLRECADAHQVSSVVVSFDPHPLHLLRPAVAPTPLTWPAQRRQLLLDEGVDEVIIYRTTRELLSLTAEGFFEQIVRERLRAVGLVEGRNFGFGRGRGGDVDLLGRLCHQEGIDLEIVGIQGGSADYSSTRIRDLLVEGDLDGANEILGRPHRVRGTVHVGEQRATGLGFPTANLNQIEVLIPKDGVYATRVYVPGKESFFGACNVGPNPTFDQQDRKFEVHLLGFDGDLYGQSLEVDFLRRLRDTRRFSGIEDLKRQVGQDLAAVRNVAERS